jgi:flagellar biosynthesis protein FlhB
MAVNPIQQILVAFASLVVLLVAYVIFGPMIDSVLAGLVTDYISGAAGTPLEQNAGALLLTKDIVLVGMKIFIWLVIFAVVARMFLYLGYVTEERGVY